MNGSKQSQTNRKIKKMIISFGKMKRSQLLGGEYVPKVGDFIIKTKGEKKN